jgi:hypothetical protein
MSRSHPRLSPFRLALIGNVVAQFLGLPPGKLSSRRLYTQAVSVLTLNGETIVGFARIPCVGAT